MSSYSTDAMGWEPIEASAPAIPAAKPLGFMCKSGHHGSVVTSGAAHACSLCGVRLSPVFAGERAAIHFQSDRCPFCGDRHPVRVSC